ncbi:phospholipase D family protein [Alkalimarinus coralli]|uniref:phospholipase D family protein n=1 Tax=Alkalimarinus coralli TaxID=2935863 RepID=UPI00202B3AED|nr:phospholipase D family protein [Alkalimarinus coralli]
MMRQAGYDAHSKKCNIQFLITIILLFTAGCASLPENEQQVKSVALVAPSSSVWSEFASDNMPENNRESAFLLLNEGIDAFVARMALVSAAEVSIDAQYYIWHGDLTGNLLINELINAAERGVRVRLLIDDINLSAANDEGLALIASHPKISVRIFNPFSRNTAKASQMITRFGDVTRRMHNKSFVVDGQISVIGGRNIGDEYFGANSELEFADLDVLSIGPVVEEVSSVFDLYWNSPLAYPVELLRPELIDSEYAEKKRTEISDFAAKQKHSAFADNVRQSSFLQQLLAGNLEFFSGEVELLYDLPDKITSKRDQTELHLSGALGQHIDVVESEFLIISPYFVPTDEGVRFMLGLEERGVEVKVVTNSLASTDVSIVHAGYKSSREALLRGGVELYEMKAGLASDVDLDKHSFGSSKASLHAKTFVIDRESLFVGSLNIDPRSFNENTEIGMLIYSKHVAQAVGEWFDSDIQKLAYVLSWDENEKRIMWLDYNNDGVSSYDHDPGTSWWLRRWVDFLGLFPIESQL